MTNDAPSGPGPRSGQAARDAARQERLAAALRQNLSRRKAQIRARETFDPAASPGFVPEKD